MSVAKAEPTLLVPVRASELRMLIAALDNAEATIRRESPDEKGAYRAVALLRARLRRRLDDEEAR